jgi:hypothetical protein
MKLNTKELRRIRRALRSEATGLVKFRKKILESGAEDNWRWKSWVRSAPAVVRRFQTAAEAIDDLIRCGGDTSFLQGAATLRESRKRKPKPRDGSHLRLVHSAHQTVQ